MVGNNRFSLTGFSLSGSGGETILVDGSFFAELQSVTGGVTVIHTPASFLETARGVTRGTLTTPEAFSGIVRLESRAAMVADVVTHSDVIENLNGLSTGSKDIKVLDALSAYMASAVWAGKNIPHKIKVFDSGQMQVFGSKNVPTDMVGFEVATTFAEAGKQTQLRVTVEIAIPPGSDLRIDADTFRVLLGPENVLYAQQGDWIKLSRETVRLDIESVSGGRLEGWMTYQERFL